MNMKEWKRFQYSRCSNCLDFILFRNVTDLPFSIWWGSWLMTYIDIFQSVDDSIVCLCVCMQTLSVPIPICVLIIELLHNATGNQHNDYKINNEKN